MTLFRGGLGAGVWRVYGAKWDFADRYWRSARGHHAGLHWGGRTNIAGSADMDTFRWTSRADVEPFLWKNMRCIRKECESMAPNSKFPWQSMWHMAWQSHIVHDIYFLLAGITPCAPLLLSIGSHNFFLRSLNFHILLWIKTCSNF